MATHVHCRLLLSCILPLLTLCVGCGSAAKQPTASLRSADLGSVTEQGLQVNFDLNVENPNSFALPVSAAKYKLGLGGVEVVEGTAKPSASVPANGTLPVTLPVNLTFDNLLSAERAITSSGGNVPYTLEGELEFSAGPLAALGQGIRVPLKFNGTLPLRDAFKDPVALLKSPEGRKLAELIFGRSVLTDLLGR